MGYCLLIACQGITFVVQQLNYKTQTTIRKPMSAEQINAQLLKSVLATEANMEQVIQRLDSIDKRLSNIEIKMSKVEKWVALENADFTPIPNE